MLAGLLRHPNAGGVLVLGLGCENNQLHELLAIAGEVDASRIRFFNTQDVVDEVEEGLDAVAELVRAGHVRRLRGIGGSIEAKLRELVETAAAVMPERRATRPTRASQRRRVDSKVKRGQVKAGRRKLEGE